MSPDTGRAIVNLRAAAGVLEEAGALLSPSADPAIASLLGHADALITAALYAIGGKEVPTSPRRIGP